MRWLSQSDVEAKLRTQPHIEEIVRLFGISEFLDNAFYPANFNLTAEWESAVVLSEEGEAIASKLHHEGILDSPRLTSFTLLRMFSYGDLLIDCQASDFGRIVGFMSQLHLRDGVRWPYVYGHALYDKFNDSYQGNRTDFLEAAEVEALLAGTPQGVSQIGPILSGPFGFLESVDWRIVPPTLKLPLWHCSDAGCGSLHLVEAHNFHIPTEVGIRRALRYLFDCHGPKSEWRDCLIRKARGLGRHTGRPYADIVAVLADCVVGTERGKLLETILSSSSGTQLRATLRRERSAIGRSDQISGSLSPEEQHQILLTLDDQTIVQFLDLLIARRDIDLPPSEVRTFQTYGYRPRRDWPTKISSLGVNSSIDAPIVRIYSMIWSTYEKLGMLDDLSWRIRYVAGSASSPKHALMEYLRRKGPEEAVKDLILSSKAVTIEIGRSLLFNVQDGEDATRASKRLLWKLGFRVPRFDDEYLILRNRLSEFKAAVIQTPPRPTEDDRAKIRSIGVNLFVSIEAFLEDILIFNVWMLASDHLIKTKFKYVKQDGLAAVARVLGDHISSGDDKLSWSRTGANSLGVLLGYFAAFRNWLRQLPETNREAIERVPDDYPFYADDQVEVFPYHHVELWGDIPAEVLATYTKLIDDIFIQAAQSDLTKVRNGLDHKREEEDFPEADKMLACATRLDQMFEGADARCLIPKLVWTVRTERDLNGNSTRTAQDYRGHPYTIDGPSPVARLDAEFPKDGRPYILAPFDFLGLPNSFISFTTAPTSTYRRYWNGYPKRRVIEAVPNLSVQTPE